MILVFCFGNVIIFLCCRLLAKLCLTVFDPMDCSPSDSSVHGISQAYWSGLPFPSPGDLSDSRIKPSSPVWTGRFFTVEPPGKPLIIFYKTMLFLFFHFFFACLQGRNREADIKNGLVDTGWKGEGGMKWKSRL